MPLGHSLEGEEGDCGLYSSIALFQESTADKERRHPSRENRSETKKIEFKKKRKEKKISQQFKQFSSNKDNIYCDNDQFCVPTQMLLKRDEFTSSISIIIFLRLYWDNQMIARGWLKQKQKGKNKKGK